MHEVQLMLGLVLVLASLGVILFQKPVHASLSFLLTLLCLAAMYLSLSAEFIAVMQVFVYAGAILIIFMFVIVLFQDAHEQISRHPARSSPWLLATASVAFGIGLLYLARDFLRVEPVIQGLPQGFGTVQSLGYALYVDFFFPFEAITLLFLVAVVGALYIGRKEKV